MQGYQMEKNPDSTAVINIVPPRELWSEIQSIRTKYVAEARCGPHISFIDPFVTPKYYDQARILLEQELSQMEPFTISLKKLNYFVHKKSATLYLEPTIQPEYAIQELYDRIVKLFPQCNDQALKSTDGKLIPHITLAKFKNVNELLINKQEIEKKWKPISFQMKEIYLLFRNGPEPFEVKHVVPLGNPSINLQKPHFGPGSAKSESLVARTIVLAGMPKNAIGGHVDLKEFCVKAGMKAEKVEVVLNPNGQPRPIGIIQFSTKEEAEEACRTFSYQPYSGATIHVKPLECMVFPDVIGGSCTLRSRK